MTQERSTPQTSPRESRTKRFFKSARQVLSDFKPGRKAAREEAAQRQTDADSSTRTILDRIDDTRRTLESELGEVKAKLSTLLAAPENAPTPPEGISLAAIAATAKEQEEAETPPEELTTLVLSYKYTTYPKDMPPEEKERTFRIKNVPKRHEETIRNLAPELLGTIKITFNEKGRIESIHCVYSQAAVANLLATVNWEDEKTQEVKSLVEQGEINGFSYINGKFVELYVNNTRNIPPTLKEDLVELHVYKPKNPAIDLREYPRLKEYSFYTDTNNRVYPNLANDAGQFPIGVNEKGEIIYGTIEEPTPAEKLVATPVTVATPTPASPPIDELDFSALSRDDERSEGSPTTPPSATPPRPEAPPHPRTPPLPESPAPHTLPKPPSFRTESGKDIPNVPNNAELEKQINVLEKAYILDWANSTFKGVDESGRALVFNAEGNITYLRAKKVSLKDLEEIEKVFKSTGLMVPNEIISLSTIEKIDHCVDSFIFQDGHVTAISLDTIYGHDTAKETSLKEQKALKEAESAFPQLQILFCGYDKVDLTQFRNLTHFFGYNHGEERGKYNRWLNLKEPTKSDQKPDQVALRAENGEVFWGKEKPTGRRIKEVSAETRRRIAIAILGVTALTAAGVGVTLMDMETYPTTPPEPAPASGPQTPGKAKAKAKEAAPKAPAKVEKTAKPKPQEQAEAPSPPKTPEQLLQESVIVANIPQDIRSIRIKMKQKQREDAPITADDIADFRIGPDEAATKYIDSISGKTDKETGALTIFINKKPIATITHTNYPNPGKKVSLFER